MTVVLYLLYACVQAGIYAFMVKSKTFSAFVTFVFFAPVITVLIGWFVYSIVSSRNGVQ